MSAAALKSRKRCSRGIVATCLTQVGGLIKGLAPNASEAYRRSMDQKALPEVLKCLSTEGFPEFLAHLRDLVPGART